MITKINTDNRFFIKGNVTRLNVYAEGKAANIVVAVHRSDSENDIFINLKSFQPKSFNQLSVGMAVEVYGSIGTSAWKDKNGEVHYENKNDLIADTIIFDETKQTTMHRQAMEAYE